MKITQVAPSRCVQAFSVLCHVSGFEFDIQAVAMSFIYLSVRFEVKYDSRTLKLLLEDTIAFRNSPATACLNQR